MRRLDFLDWLLIVSMLVFGVACAAPAVSGGTPYPEPKWTIKSEPKPPAAVLDVVTIIDETAAATLRLARPQPGEKEWSGEEKRAAFLSRVVGVLVAGQMMFDMLDPQEQELVDRAARKALAELSGKLPSKDI